MEKGKCGQDRVREIPKIECSLRMTQRKGERCWLVCFNKANSAPLPLKIQIHFSGILSLFLLEIACLGFQWCLSFVSCEALLIYFNKCYLVISNVNVLIGNNCVYFGDNCWHAAFYLIRFHSCFFMKVILIVFTEASQHGITTKTYSIRNRCKHRWKQSPSYCVFISYQK